VAVIGIVAAVLLLGLGFLGGSLLTDGGGHHRFPALARDGHGQFYGPQSGSNGRAFPHRAAGSPPSPSSTS